MFGGVGFMVNGNLVAAASKRGLLLRVGREREVEALAQPGIRPMEMRGRRMEGYVYADPPPRSEDAMKAWLRPALDYVQSLPPKSADARATRAQGQRKWGLSEILCAGPGFHQVLTKRSPNMMANWVLASAHSRGGIFHC